MPLDPRQHQWDPLPVADVAALLGGCPARWWLSGGWAVDHRLGASTRPHGDVDVSTVRTGLPVLLDSLPAGLRPFAAHDGRLFPLADAPADAHNFWVLRDGRWVLQLNLEDGDGLRWRYRRDPRVTLPWDRAVDVVRGVPTGAAAVQLLWKARTPRPQDEHDLDVVHGVLGPQDRRWLREAIGLSHPASPWLTDARLGGEHPDRSR